MKHLSPCLIATIAGLLLAAAGPPAAAQNAGTAQAPGTVASENVAVVNGTAITRAAFESELQAAVERLSQSGQPVSQMQSVVLRQQVVESLVNEELLVQESRKQSIDVPEDKVTADFEAIKSRFPTEADFKAALEHRDMDEGKLQEKLRRRLSIQQLMEKALPATFESTDAEKRQFYDENLDMFHQDESVRASHILIQMKPDADEKTATEARKKIEAVQKEVAAGGDFAELAKTHSEGPSGPQGGDLGFFSKGQMVKPFEDAAFGMKVGETSGVVQTDFGLHLIRVTDRKPESTVSYEDAAADIGTMLVERKRRAAFEAYVDGLRGKADIVIPNG